MTCMANVSGHEELRRKARKITELIALIQEYPAEAQVIMAAVEDGLTLGPAQIMNAVHAADQHDLADTLAG